MKEGGKTNDSQGLLELELVWPLNMRSKYWNTVEILLKFTQTLFKRTCQLFKTVNLFTHVLTATKTLKSKEQRGHITVVLVADWWIFQLFHMFYLLAIAYE